MSKMIFVNLPVADVAASTRFYEAIGFTKDDRFSNDQASAMVWSDTISFMLLSHNFFRSFTPKAIPDAHTSNEVLLCLSMESRAEVDAIVEKAIAAGSKGDISPADEHGFMYGRNFEDLDGHVFAPMWMDAEAAMSMSGGEMQPA